MTCERVTLPGGVTAIVCGPRKPRARCVQCGRSAGLLCDWKLPVAGTCSAPICTDCSTSPVDDKDLCPTHTAAFQQWLKRKDDQ